MTLEDYRQLVLRAHGGKLQKLGVNIPQYEPLKVQVSQESGDREYIEQHLLPAIRRIANVPLYQSYANFMENREKAGFKNGMTLEDYRQLVLRTHGVKLQQLGVNIPQYQSSK